MSPHSGCFSFLVQSDVISEMASATSKAAAFLLSSSIISASVLYLLLIPSKPSFTISNAGLMSCSSHCKLLRTRRRHVKLSSGVDDDDGDEEDEEDAAEASPAVMSLSSESFSILARD